MSICSMSSNAFLTGARLEGWLIGPLNLGPQQVRAAVLRLRSDGSGEINVYSARRRTVSPVLWLPHRGYWLNWIALVYVHFPTGRPGVVICLRRRNAPGAWRKASVYAGWSDS